MSVLHRPLFQRAVAGAGLVVACAMAMAAPATRQPHTPAERLKATIERTRALHAASADPSDVTPPVLTKLTAVGDVQAQGTPKIDIDVGITDDLSGLQTVIISVVGPSGQMVQWVEGLQTAQRELTGRLAVGADVYAAVPFTRFSEPGPWVVDSVFLSDNNYNMKIYGREDLAALGGRTTFNVVNPGGYDVKPPTLRRARLETRSVSLSVPSPGSAPGTLPYISARLETSDEGNGVVSGTYEAILEYCLMNQYNDCVDTFELTGHASTTGQARSSFRVGGQPRADQAPGTYRLLHLYVSDLARNFTFLSEGDFDGVFPAPSVVIQP
jgi:hypothetical protein